MTKFLKSLGPGLLYAGAAVGVSHLVQSTRAGAEYGLVLIVAVVLSNFLKYPFFEFGPRYTIATGKSLLEGYQKLGKWAFYTFIIITVCTMFTIQATVTLVCAGIAGKLFNIELSTTAYAAIVLVVCSFILIKGKYKILDKAIKAVILLLSVTSIAALVSGFINFDVSLQDLTGNFDFGSTSNLIFLIALVGWMPAPLDISVWQSLWTLEKSKSGEAVLYKEQRRDFHIGYWGTALLAVVFVSLGAVSLYNTGEELPASSVGFAGKLIEIYTKNIGPQMYWIIGVAAFTTMFSTVLTVLDAYPRSLANAAKLSLPNWGKSEQKIYTVLLIVTVIMALIILFFFTENMKSLIEFATIVSFITAPVLAFFNYRVITGSDVSKSYKPNLFETIVCFLGGLFLLFFVAFYVYINLI